jgi:hypothetical protein
VFETALFISLAAFVIWFCAFAIWFCAFANALFAAFIALETIRFAFAFALDVSLPPHAIPRAVRASKPVSAMIFFICN